MFCNNVKLHKSVSNNYKIHNKLYVFNCINTRLLNAELLGNLNVLLLFLFIIIK